MPKRSFPKFDTLLPMEAKSVSVLPRGAEWKYEPKWDGFRCIAVKKNNKITLHSKSGKPLNRYFPDIVETLETLKAESFILDGELVIEVDNSFSFSELQLRLHPAASRVQKLVTAHHASYIVFDMLETTDGIALSLKPFSQRRKELEKFHKKHAAKNPHILLSPQTSSLDSAKIWLKDMGGRIDGIIAKDMTQIYQPGERIMQKYKFIRTADCVVGGFRYGTDSPYVGSLLLGLYDEDGLLNHVGFTSSIAAEDRLDLTKKLAKLIGGPGFTGRTPGGPSRWSTERSTEWEPLKTKLVAEVAFDHVSDDRFRHGTRLIRWRLDKAPEQCRMEQLYQIRVKTD
jgi:ATP-dependent DNA ligase